MIVVIADDFTGAAEVAGLGLMHGLSVELDIEGVWSSGADLLVNPHAEGVGAAPGEAHPELRGLAVGPVDLLGQVAAVKIVLQGVI